MTPRAGVVVAVVQPHLADGRSVPDAVVERACALVAEAAARGAEIVLFPEGYPGPLRIGVEFDAEPRLARAARQAGCAVCWSRVEEVAPGRPALVVHLTDVTGARAGRYVRAHPATGDVHAALSGTGLFPGDGFVCVPLGGITVGVLVCSELWLPEVARVLALRGAELLLAPAGGGFHEVRDTWQLMAQARAIENECFVALTQHRFGEEAGAALIAGPEGIVAASADAELLTATLDLDRMRWLRARDDSMESPKPFRALPGLLRARRPALYAELAEPREGLVDYERPVMTSTARVVR